MFRHQDRVITAPLVQWQYDKTYDFSGDYINDEHRALAQQDGLLTDFAGWLYPPDALKLYELAYFAAGDILELGTGPGLSTCVLIQALLASGRNAGILTVDLNTRAVSKALQQLAGRQGLERVNFWCIKAVHALQELVRRQRRFGLVFVDDSHRYEEVRDECVELMWVLLPGAFALIHDYCDARNADPGNQEYAVYQGVQRGLTERYWEFWGIYGCAGLFRRRL